MSTKNSQNTSKTLQNIRDPRNTKHRKTLFLKKHSQNYRNKKTAEHPQNTAKHRKTPQNTFANKTDRIS